MNLQNLRLKEEVKFSEELRKALQVDMMAFVLLNADFEEHDDFYINLLQNHHLQITKELLPDLFNICTDVLGKLQFEEPIVFYILNSEEMNAFTIPSLKEGKPHIIGLNSLLVERLNSDELKFVIGHEIGHIISNNSQISKILRFLFPDGKPIPLILQNKINFWDKLSELTADRYGYLASPNLEAVVNSFFKLSSGLSTSKLLPTNFSAYIKQNDEILKKFSNDSHSNSSTHPINPIRLKAIEYFSKSKLIANADIKEDTNLTKSISKLLGNYRFFLTNKLDEHRMYFMASAGLLVASIDDEISKEEIDIIVSALSNFLLDPEETINKLLQSEKIPQIFEGSIAEILKANPSEKYSMIKYIIDIAIVDNNFAEKELAWIIQVGLDILKFDTKELFQIIAESLNRNYIPKLI